MANDDDIMRMSNWKLVIIQLAWSIHPVLLYLHINIVGDRGQMLLDPVLCSLYMCTVPCNVPPVSPPPPLYTATVPTVQVYSAPVPPFSWRWSPGAGWGWSPEQTGKHETINIELVSRERENSWVTGAVQCRGSWTILSHQKWMHSQLND